MNDSESRLTLVFAAAVGIGAAFSRLMCQGGWHVARVEDLHEKPAKELAAEIGGCTVGVESTDATPAPHMLARPPGRYPLNIETQMALAVFPPP